MPAHHEHTAMTIWERLWALPGDFWLVLGEMAPYLLFGFLAAGVLSVVIKPETVERHLGGRGLWPVVKAALFGVPLPLCSCGVIPVSASLRRHGATRGAVTAFLISTPQTGVDSILATYALMGGLFAIFRPLFALLSGVLGGAVVAAVTEDRGTLPGATPQDKPLCTDSCCQGPRRNRLVQALAYGFGDLPMDIGKSLLIGLLVAAAISAVLPPQSIAAALGVIPEAYRGVLTIAVMMLAGIPVYVCATASIPVAAVLILEQGVSPGAAFAFLMTGPATNAATIATVWNVMGRRTALVYLLTMAGAALAGGLILDYLLHATGTQVEPPGAAMMPGWVTTLSAVTLLGLLAVALVRAAKGRRTKAPAGEAAKATRLRVTGMTCTHCQAAVTRALSECPGVSGVQVDLGSGVATVTGSAGFETLAGVVRELGYEPHRMEQ